MKNIIADFGAVPGLANNSQAAFDAAMACGGRIHVPEFPFSVPNGITMTKPTILEGDGWGSSQIYTGPGVPALTIRPDPTIPFYDGWGVEELYFQPAAGNHSILIDLAHPGVFLNKALFRRIFFQGTDGANAIYLNNPVNNDGFFCSTIEECLSIGGGFNLPRAGDSLTIARNTLTGPGTGISASHVPGAAVMTIEDNNLTTQGGLLLLQFINQARIIGNNCESFGAAVQFILAACSNCEITGNEQNTHNATICTVLENGTANTIFDKNKMSAATHISIGPATPGTAVLGTNKFYDSVSGAAVDGIILNQSPPLWVPQPLS